MKPHAALLPVLLLLLGACGGAPELQGPVDVEGPGYRGVILDRSAWPPYAYEVQGFWAPTLEDVRRAEAALPGAVRQHAPHLAVPLERYYRQYIGIVEEDRRLLLVNLVHEQALAPHPDEYEDERSDPRTELFMVSDGGDWHVEAFFDPETGAYRDLWVHGEA